MKISLGKAFQLFFKNIFSAFNIYSGHPIFRVFTAISTYISIILFVLPRIDFLFSESVKLWIKNDLAAFFLPILAIFIMLNNFIILVVRENILGKSDNIKKEVFFESLRNYLDILMRFYKWENGYRITLFIPQKQDSRDIIVPLDRITYGKSPGISKNSKLCFQINQGMPGLAWAKSWNGDDYSSLIDALQVKHIPPSKFKSEKTLKNFFKEVFNINDETFDTLSEKKSKIRSYMAIGFSGRHGKLSGVLVIDSESEESFIDFETLKRINRGVVEGKHLNMKTAIVHAPEKITDSKKSKSTPKKVDNQGQIDDIVKKIQDPSLPEEERLKLFGLAQITLSQFQRPFELDKFVLVISIIVRNIQRLLNEVGESLIKND